MRASKRLIAALFIVTLVLGAVAGFTFKRYADVHLRSRPRLPKCVLVSRAALRKPVAVSGTEPRQTLSGETVYLTRAEDVAVSCASSLDKNLARILASALAKQEPTERAQALLQMVRDEIPADPGHDPQAFAGYMMASGAIAALPRTPEVDAAFKDLNMTMTCRFNMPRPCPTRPPMPLLVWFTGIPASIGVVALVSMGLTGLGSWWKRRKKAAPTNEAKTSETKEASQDSDDENKSD